MEESVQVACITVTTILLDTVLDLLQLPLCIVELLSLASSLNYSEFELDNIYVLAPKKIPKCNTHPLKRTCDTAFRAQDRIRSQCGANIAERMTFSQEFGC